jgi:nitrogen fixation protein NifU and related proteins
MSDLTDLYQEVILDHNRQPRNYGALADATAQAEGHNPLCGDRVTVFVKAIGDRIETVRFEGSGCAISRASASLMAEAVSGRSREETEALFERFRAMVTAPLTAEIDDTHLGKLAVLAGVRAFPVRVKCASLAWHALKTALAGSPGSNESRTTKGG